jgi:hypothetical protein
MIGLPKPAPSAQCFDATRKILFTSQEASLKNLKWQFIAVAMVALLSVRAAMADSVIAPFIDSQTSGIIYLDLSNIDMDAVGAWQQKAIATIPDEAKRAQQQDQADKSMVTAKKWVSDFKAAGGKDLYVVVSLAGLMQGTPGGMIVPLNGTDGSALTKVVNPNGNPPPGDPNDPQAAQQSRMQPQTSVIGNMLVYSTGSGLTKMKTPSTEPRQDLLDALSSGGDSTLHVVLTPSTVKNNPLFAAIVNSRMRAGNNTQPPFSEPQWDNVNWLSISVVAPPKESGNCTIQCKDAASAQAMADLINKKIADGKADFIDKQKMSPDDYEKMAAALKPTVTDKQVVISLDANAIDNVMLPIMSRASQSPAAPAPGGAPPTPDSGNGNGM